MKPILIITLVLLYHLSYSQSTDYPVVNSTYYLNHQTSPEQDAQAIFLLETGKTHLDISDSDRGLRIFHTYKARIKILSQEGFNQANFTVPLYKFGKDFEYTEDITGKTYNYENGRIVETIMDHKNIVTENKNDFLRLTKFTLPNIKVGSIIEIEYRVVSPDIFNFRSWQYQSDIPKLRSEYNVRIPAITNYNVVLKGILKLEDTKTKRENGCIAIFGTRVDCSNITYTMSNIPSFKEEAYMLAPKNYISAINFELVEMTNQNGGVNKYTKAWKDVDLELMTERSFGGQLKKVNFMRDQLDPAILKNQDTIFRAKEVYRWVSQHIRLNNVYGKFAQYGIEDALKSKSGNVGDINLALITALNAADIEAYPVIISTRNNGLPHDLHPILTDFNYVIAAVKLNNEFILVDATDPLAPFGQLPLHCINGRGRIIYSRKSSEWIELSNKIISMKEYSFKGKLTLDGKLQGTLSITTAGLDALNRRKSIIEFPSFEEYAEDFDDKLNNISIQKSTLTGLDNPEQLLIEEYKVDIKLKDELKPGLIQFNPIFISRTTKNPFNLDERNYDVDLGARKIEKHSVEIELPEGFTFNHGPKHMNMVLPDNSARYYYKSSTSENKLTVAQQLSLDKAIYTSQEYFGLKELFSRVIQHMQIDYQFNYQTK
ncbi:DUF3857 domain-containing protein [Sphingobacterium bovistauri]|uniref:DUF3857 and transglutaminase domain-containing protein n=1 Tax=Sphingobacterium bovistauri TaxID=2781959 RepID=A0ABS7Z6S7_9SPHI|nr:DUF3857 domain-containing protein [Sphingobacterium bovistauri]MCA5005842.1 DUF3857 and transglutaminase domain-containing protein [Sphingobacterium bovistauri]